MHKNARVGLIGLAVLLCFVVVILLLNLEHLKSTPANDGSCVNLDGGETCHAKDKNPYRNYGTKTAYHVTYKDDDKSIDLKGCTPELFYMLSRHATRYPDEEYIIYINTYLPELKEKIINAFENGTAKLCAEDIKRLKEWFPTMKPDDQNKLSITGGYEAAGLGARMKEKFSSLLSMPYSPESFIMEHTSRDRTRDTAENFAKGLFTEQEYNKINFTGKINDKVLQFHKNCKKIKKTCDNPDFDIKEVEKFANGTLMQGVVSSVSKRIGFDVKYEDVKHMYVACTFGYSLNISDAWCAIFSTDDLKVLEFYDDIDDYYKDGYGNAVNYQQACPVVKYVVDLFKSYENDEKRKVVLQFSHAGGIKKVYAAFGLFRDANPLTDNFCALNNRKWRTSVISPFNTNIIFVLYNCNGDLKFIALHNETPILVDGCDNKLCSLEQFYNKYEPTAQNCNLNEICNVCKI